MTHLRYAGIAFAVACAAAGSSATALANDRIGIDLRSTTPTVAVGDVIGVQIFAVREPSGGSSFVGLGEAFTVLDLFFTWNPQDLRLLGMSPTGTAPELISSGFVSPTSDYTQTNEANPPADGNGYYSALALGFNPVYATTEGTLVATFRFQVLREFASTEVTPIPAVPVPGTQIMENTKVLDAAVPGYDSIGSLSSVILTQGSSSPCPADLNADGSVESYDLSQVLAAWGTVESPANLVRDQGSPSVDGADLAYLLAAWGPCGG